MKKADNATPYNAAEYDENIRKTIPYYESFSDETNQLVKTARPRPELWVDTGCGTGHLVSKALNEFPETRFILADPSKGMLEQARQRLAGHENVRFLEPVGSQGLPNHLTEKADVITAIQCHHYLQKDQRASAIAACYEALKDGGLLVVFENIRPETKEGLKIGIELWRQFQLAQGRSEAAVEAHLKRFDVEYFPITVREHLELLRESGFRTAELFWHSCMQAGFYAVK